MSFCFQITLVRHGETEENRQQIIQGQRDTVLSETGFHQGRLVSTRLAKETFTQVYSSDLIRAKATADLIVNSHQQDIIIDKRLRERCFGVLEGCKINDLKTAASREGVKPAKHNPRGGETLQQVTARVESFFSDLCSYCSKQCSSAPPLASKEGTILSQYLIDNHASVSMTLQPSAHYLVVSHGGFIHAFIHYLQDQFICDFPERTRIPNTSVTSMVVTLDQEPDSVQVPSAAVDGTVKCLLVTSLCIYDSSHL